MRKWIFRLQTCEGEERKINRNWVLYGVVQRKQLVVVNTEKKHHGLFACWLMDNHWIKGESVKFWFVCFVCSIAKWPVCRYIIYKRRPKTCDISTHLVLSSRTIEFITAHYNSVSRGTAIVFGALKYTEIQLWLHRLRSK